MDNFSVTKNGKELNSELYSWNPDTRTFFSNEKNLVLDFSGWDHCTFTTGSSCIFTAGSSCTFKTHLGCTFTTGTNCTFYNRF